MLYGLDERALYADSEAILMMLISPEDGAALKLQVDAPTAGTTLYLRQGNRTEIAQVTGGQIVVLPLTAEAVYISADHEIQINGYSTR